MFIPIAMALAQFAPMIAGWLGGSKAEDVASKVVDVAKAVTGQSAPDAALAAIQADPALSLQFQQAVLAQQAQLAATAADVQKAQMTYEKDIYAAEAGDRANARDLASKQPNDFMRPLLGLAIVAATIAMSLLIVLGYANSVITNTTAALTVGTVIGYLFSESKSVLGFYFGMTKDSSAQTKTITDFAVAPGTVSGNEKGTAK